MEDQRDNVRHGSWNKASIFPKHHNTERFSEHLPFPQLNDRKDKRASPFDTWKAQNPCHSMRSEHCLLMLYLPHIEHLHNLSLRRCRPGLVAVSESECYLYCKEIIECNHWLTAGGTSILKSPDPLRKTLRRAQVQSQMQSNICRFLLHSTSLSLWCDPDHISSDIASRSAITSFDAYRCTKMPPS